ncbi:actin-domain-containing protein [Phanerochaete sordida]|uniref:Actin-domain-containing protein n=1 Tax=Phanerochaete sordida TaxID=48140 RepID=A0A9P3LH52_9APHY|nr:actin-domain-containing protein [Phanerochaete sordida]
MSTTPAGTPRRPTAHYESTTPLATPQTTRTAATANIIQSSPHYSTTRRHSLYGTEDRIILDPGSCVWRVGFSGEGKPRDVFLAGADTGKPLWTLNRATAPGAREEEDKLLEARLQKCLRAVFHDSLLTDPKSRKVIIIEQPLLPLHIKEALARILFNNLQVPSISFASSHLLALLAAGRITGLVVDCGHLESIALPIYSSRPLFPHLKSSPLAGSRFSSHLRALLLLFGTYHPPPESLTSSNATPTTSRATRVPEAVLTDAVIENVKTRCCFVGEALETDIRPAYTATYDYDTPSAPSEATRSDAGISESGYTMVSGEAPSEVQSQASASNASESQQGVPPSSDFSVVPSVAPSTLDRPKPGESHLQALANLYQRHSTATDLHIRVEPPPSQQQGTGRGTLVIPGWIRERAAEVLFEGGDVDESSVAEVILDSLLKVPVDLRKSLASAILVVGGTPMLPGFIPRLHAELLRTLTRQTSPVPTPGARGRPRAQGYDRYAPLRSLAAHIAILNNPTPPPPASSRAVANAGKAPAFTSACMAWVGGSLAGALKTGGAEVAREKWDEADALVDEDDDDAMEVSPVTPRSAARSILPDWTRSPLPVGAPPANAKPAAAPVPEMAPEPAMHIDFASPRAQAV